IQLLAVKGSLMVDIPVPDAKRFDSELLAFLDSRFPDIGRAIAEQGTLPDELVGKLREAIHDFRAVFAPSEGGPLKEAQAAPLVGEEQETMKKFRRPSPEEYEQKAGPAGQSDVQLPG